MDTETLGLALAAGMLASVNPCGFAMLPAYLTLVVAGQRSEHSGAQAVGRALAATGAMALGFIAVFGLFGLVITPLASTVHEYMPVATLVIGAVMIGLGGWMLAGRTIRVFLPKPRSGAPTARLASMVGYGFAYAIVSLSCSIGPFLAVTSSTFSSGSVLGGIAAFVTYGLGMALVVAVLAVAIAVASSAVTDRLRKILPYVNRIGGGLLVLVGLYVSYYGVYELRLFHGEASVEDSVIDGAAEVQTTLADLVDGAGAFTLVIAIAVIVALGVGLPRALVRRRDSTRS